MTALTRHPEVFPISDEKLSVVSGDVLDADTVAADVRGQDAVISTLGVPYGRKEITE